MSETGSVRRTNMVRSQLLTNRVTDQAVTAAIEAIPREVFVPAALRGVAYVDEDVPIGNGRYIMEPMVFARLIQAAAIVAGELVLIVACGEGYAACVLAKLAETVVGLDDDGELVDRANTHFAELGIDNAAATQGDMSAGLADQGPFDVIFVNGGVAQVPQALLGQLAVGGRLVAVRRGDGGSGHAMLYRADGRGIAGRVLFDAQVPVLPAFAGRPGFSF